MANEYFNNFYTLEGSLAQWLIIVFAMMTFAVVLHINLHSLAGICLMIVGVVFILLILCGYISWQVIGDHNLIKLVSARRILLLLKFLLILIITALCIWAIVVMIKQYETSSYSEDNEDF
jgi:hypothetical protein